MTKLCCFNQDNPYFSVFERHAELTERVHSEDWVTLKLSRFEPTGLSRLKPTTTDELRVALQTTWEELPQEHVNKAVANFTKCLCASYIWLWLPTVVTPSTCSNSVHLQVCILISSPTNWLFSEPPTDLCVVLHWLSGKNVRLSCAYVLIILVTYVLNEDERG